MTADDYFLYVVLEDASVNVYKPSAASHECLFH